ncbi:MAG: DUF4359 domain-containing protein [Flavobacteriaceae bacterium]|jgi:hypothetical protein|nr:DUF4359 domain-containing protein [Flavobacteriaceae bacterium]
MKIRYLALLVLVIFAGVLFFTNPNESEYQGFMKEKFTQVVNQKIEEETAKVQDPRLQKWIDLGRKFLPSVQEPVVNQLIDVFTKRENYYFFSLIKVRYHEEWHTAGFGIFNKYRLFPQIDKELQNIDLKEIINQGRK